jgi:hypothetical protein
MLERSVRRATGRDKHLTSAGTGAGSCSGPREGANARRHGNWRSWTRTLGGVYGTVSARARQRVGERGRFGVVCSFGLSWCGRVVDLRCGKRNVTALAAAGLGVFPSGSPGKAQSVLSQQPASEVNTRTRTTAEDSLFARRAIPAACPACVFVRRSNSLLKPAPTSLSLRLQPQRSSSLPTLATPRHRRKPSPPRCPRYPLSLLFLWNPLLGDTICIEEPSFAPSRD